MIKNQRFIFLDGLRGIAAIIVVILHFSSHNNGRHLFPSAGLAVDLFFCMSGFVIAWSYLTKLQNGMKWSMYFKKRLIRLYPMFLLGLTLGLVVFSLKAYLNISNNPWSDYFYSTIFNIFYLPYLATPAPPRLDGIFLTNIPSWSLFFEVIANILFVLVIGLSRSKLLLVTIVTGLIMILSAIYFDTSPGWSSTNWIGGFPRVGYSFMVGVLIYKVFEDSKDIKTFSPIILSILLCVILAAPFYEYVSYWIICTLVVMPVIVWWGTRSRVENPIQIKICDYLGWISYPLYCLHFPMLHLIDIIPFAITNRYLKLLILFIITLAITHLVAKYFDEPIRKKLNAHIKL